MTVITARVGSDKYPTVISVGALSDLLVFCGNYTSSSALVVCDQYFQSADLSLYSELSDAESVMVSLVNEIGRK